MTKQELIDLIADRGTRATIIRGMTEIVVSVLGQDTMLTVPASPSHAIVWLDFDPEGEEINVRFV